MEIGTTISNLIRDQFPERYRENGPLFVTMVQKYFEWLEGQSASRDDWFLEKTYLASVQNKSANVVEVQSALDSGAMTVRQPAAARLSSIAVLPFEDMSAGKDQEFLCDGIAEEILRGLSRIPELYVASRTSAFQYKHQAADIRGVGARLNVDTVLEGSVRRVGNRLRVSAQLISVSDGYRIWSDRYDRDMEDIFAVQDEVTRSIAAAVPGQLESAIVKASRRKPTGSLDAYDYYLRGKELWNGWRDDDIPEAIPAFENAL